MPRRARTNPSPHPERHQGRRTSSHVHRYLANWQRHSNRYDRKHGAVLGGRKATSWGLWRIPESQLKLLGNFKGRDVLELGCGAARWSIPLANRGARVVGFDLHRFEYKTEVYFQLPYGGWIRLFTESGFVVESLTEHKPRPSESSSYLTKTGEEWARRWPLESIWQVRKTAL